jgi:hypothetical protein
MRANHDHEILKILSPIPRPIQVSEIVDALFYLTSERLLARSGNHPSMQSTKSIKSKHSYPSVFRPKAEYSHAQPAVPASEKQ